MLHLVVRVGCHRDPRSRAEGLSRVGDVWRVETSDGPIEAPKVVNAAGAWADRIAAMLGEPVPLTVIAPMLMVTSRLPAFIQPVVTLRGRKLSFKQLANGTVVIGGGHLATPYRDRNETVLDWDRLAISAATVWELFPVMRQATIVRAWAGIEASMADAASGQRHGEDVAPVVAAAGTVDSRRAAELPRPHHQRLVQQAARPQVLEQPRDGLVGVAGVLLVPLLQVAVLVPLEAVRHLNVTHPRLGEAPRQ